MQQQQAGKIVKEYNIDGVRVLMSDSAYAGKTEEELEMVRFRARRVAQNIMERYAARQREEEKLKSG